MSDSPHMQEPQLREPRRVACARCGAGFECDPDGDCWCMHVDVRLPLPPDAGASCLCAECLQAAHRKHRAQD
jgi:hypothetical protein